jgi:two-component sensor histidine kinase
MKADTWPVSVNVSIPVDLVINEMMTNSMKYAFVGREGGEIKVRGTIDDERCEVSSQIMVWGFLTRLTGRRPCKGNLSAMIVHPFGTTPGRKSTSIQIRAKEL